MEEGASSRTVGAQPDGKQLYTGPRPAGARAHLVDRRGLPIAASQAPLLDLNLAATGDAEMRFGRWRAAAILRCRS